jgi:hypothetical protein
MASSLEEHIVDDFLWGRLIADKADDEAEDAYTMAAVQYFERVLVSIGHRLDQDFVRNIRRRQVMRFNEELDCVLPSCIFAPYGAVNHSLGG